MFISIMVHVYALQRGWKTTSGWYFLEDPFNTRINPRISAIHREYQGNEGKSSLQFQAAPSKMLFSPVAQQNQTGRAPTGNFAGKSHGQIDPPPRWTSTIRPLMTEPTNSPFI